MDIQASKIELAKMILEIEDSSVLDKFLNFLRSETTLSEKQKKAIDAAIAEFEEGNGIPHNMVMEETRNRYSKYFE
jgi:predicted transcriptional regulator